MSAPQELDNKIIGRFDKLMAQAQRLIGENGQLNGTDDFAIPDREGFFQLKTSTETLIEFLFERNARGIDLLKKLEAIPPTRYGIENICGMLRGLKSDHQAGFLLLELSQIVEAQIDADYMGLAEQLLGEGHQGQHDYVPAAVLAGAVLEDALRRLCQRRKPPIDTQKPDGRPKTLGHLITDLQKAEVYNPARADMLRSWAKTRNYAAHGEFKRFNRAEVEAMIAGVKTFIADYL